MLLHVVIVAFSDCLAQIRQGHVHAFLMWLACHKLKWTYTLITYTFVFASAHSPASRFQYVNHPTSSIRHEWRPDCQRWKYWAPGCSIWQGYVTGNVWRIFLHARVQEPGLELEASKPWFFDVSAQSSSLELQLLAGIIDVYHCVSMIIRPKDPLPIRWKIYVLGTRNTGLSFPGKRWLEVKAMKYSWNCSRIRDDNGAQIFLHFIESETSPICRQLQDWRVPRFITRR